MKLEAVHTIDPATEAHYASYSTFEDISTTRHTHDFYEIFLIAQGSIVHLINDEEILLTDGHLVFIRPDDAHYYRKHTSQTCHLINLAFPAATVSAMANYLGPDCGFPHLLSSQLPPTVMLAPSEKQRVSARLQSLNALSYHQKHRAKLALRLLLMEIFSQYFLLPDDDLTHLPAWLKELCEQMQKPPHFIEGRPALMRLANRSPEYVGRMFKTWLTVTPSEYVNELRLNYAASLLIHTDYPIIDIASDAGFGNLSHFYHLFRARWQASPAQFRKTHRKTLLP
jgi:AraC family cel operon transcriptional repressor